MSLPLLRPAMLADLDALVEADRRADGDREPATAAHRQKVACFIPDGGAWVLEGAGEIVAAILFRFRARPGPEDPALDAWLFRALPDELFARGDCFGEVFTLWVAPHARRRGHATRLKQHLEAVARQRGAAFLYTHTRATDEAVLALNRKLGYRVVREGPIWDSVIRVSLVKAL